MRGAVICLLALAAVSAHPGPSGRIIGGPPTTIAQYPDMAALLYPFGNLGHRQVCGGVIINNRSILSAAHCTERRLASWWQVRLGSTFASSGGVVFDVLYVIDHPQYNPVSFDSDISIMRVRGNIFFTPLIRNAQLAGRDYHVADNQVVWAAGWGRIGPGQSPPSEELRHVQLWTVNQRLCQDRYPHNQITPNMLCAGYIDGRGGRGQCSQDSGGPLYHNGVVVGITSFGPRECGDPRQPGGNVRVQRFADWIHQNR